jgi:hypothetical protein
MGGDAYESVYGGLVARLADADVRVAAAALGLELSGDVARVTMLGREYLVGRPGVAAADGGHAPVGHRIVLAHFLLRAGVARPTGELVPYRDLPGGRDFARNLAVTVEGRIASRFARRIGALVAAARALGARPVALDLACDAVFEVDAVPRLPLRLTFADEDDDLPAEARLLYDRTAPTLLDLECLAALGGILAAELEQADEATSRPRGATPVGSPDSTPRI